MARAVTIDSATVRTAALTIDRDTQLVGMSSSGQFLLSSDPSATYANSVTAISTDRIQEQNYLVQNSGGGIQLIPSLGFSQGDVIFLSNKAVNATATLYFDP